jgi:O-antigen/teichoic acid export membrane protein
MGIIQKNFAYNSILTLSQYIVVLLTMPYVSRVLGVSNVGIVGFVDNGINYFTLFAMMGIGIVGQREIAIIRNNKAKLNAAFSSFVSFSVLLTVLVLLIYLLAIVFIPKFADYKMLFLVGTGKLVATVFLVEWLYKGLENFKFISICSIIIRLCYVASIFLFVKKTDDYVIYFILNVSVVIVNAAVNILYSRRFVSFSIKFISLKLYLQPIFRIGAYTILTSMYTTFNILFLGFVSSESEVGYYWTALKIYSIILGFYTAFTNVMLPRMSTLLAEGNVVEFRRLIDKSFELLFSISLPIIAIAQILASPIISIISGKGFEGAVIPMQIIMPLVLVVGIAQVLALQVLMPSHNDKTVFRASIIGAIIGLLLNILLVSKFGSTGTAFVLVCSEIIVTLYYIYSVRKKNIVVFPIKKLLLKLLLSVPYFIFSYLCVMIFKNSFLAVGIAVVLCFVYWLIIEKNAIKNVFFGTKIR